MICISEEAAEIIKGMISENTNDGLKLTLLSAGAGCGAPAIKLELRAPLDDDEHQEVSGINLRIRSAVVKYLDNAEITVEDSFWGKRLKVHTGYGCT